MQQPEKELKLAVDAICWEINRLRCVIDQRDKVITVLIADLKDGVAPERILEWWRQKGRPMWGDTDA